MSKHKHHVLSHYNLCNNNHIKCTLVDFQFLNSDYSYKINKYPCMKHFYTASEYTLYYNNTCIICLISFSVKTNKLTQLERG